MASVLDGADRYAGPAIEWYESSEQVPVREDDASPGPFARPEPTSHRRPRSRRRRIRRSAVTAVVAGLAITVPLMLRGHDGNEVALAPDTSAPTAPTSPPDRTGHTPALAPSGSRSTTPVSRDATRSPTSAPSSRLSSAPTPSTPAVGGVPTVQVSPDQAAAYEAQVVALTNDQRAAHGCPALRDDSRLRAAAIGHSVDMRTRAYFSHDTPDGVTPWTRIEAQGYSDPSAENIAMGQPTPEAVVDAWMNSPGHRANILNCSSKAVGVGVQFGPDGPWWTQDFGYS